MGKLIGCATVVCLLIGVALLILAYGAYTSPGLALGTLAPLPRDWGKFWGYLIAGCVFVLAPIAFMIWGAVTTSKAHPGLTLTEAIKAEDTAAAERAAKQAGYVDVKQTQHSCSPPMFTGPRAKIQVGIGSIWECTFCHTRWRLLGHEVALGMRGKNGSSWGLAPKGK